MELGVIQGVKIFIENSDNENRLWFYQKIVRNIESRKIQEKLKNRDFSMGAVLVKEGYEISDVKQFEQEFMILCLKHRLIL